jgi:glycosyltransferase involved in cell wall biosynthesis
MQIQPLLTIAVPTFNRADSLAVALSLISRGLNMLSAAQKQHVEVMVANNASTDNTREVCKIYPGITYIEQPRNLGYDENISTIYERASGTWVLFISDDDIFEYIALPVLMRILERSPHLAVIFCNWYSTDLNECKGAHEKIPVLRAGDEFKFSEICDLTPFYFLSSFVLRRIPIEKKNLLRGTYATQMEIALEVLSKESRCGVLNQFLVGRTESTKELEGGNSDSSISWKIHFGFTNVRRKYQNKFGINLSPIAELSSALSSLNYVKNSSQPIRKRLVTLFSSIYNGIAHTKIKQLRFLPFFIYKRSRYNRK